MIRKRPELQCPWKRRPLLCLLALAHALALLQGCQPDATVRDTSMAMTEELQSLRGDAENAYAAGEFAQAARLYARLDRLANRESERESERESGRESGRWRLLQADSLYLAHDYQESSGLLSLLDHTRLNNSEQALYHLLQVENAIALVNYPVFSLHADGLRRLASELRPDYQARLAWVQDLLAANIQSTGQLASLLLTAKVDELQRENAFSTLVQLPFGTLQQLRASSTAQQRQWLSAAQLARKRSIEQHFQLRDMLGAESDLVPAEAQAHISNEQRAFVDLYLESFQYPRNIAVVLPESGRLQPAADAIRKGIITGWSMIAEDKRPELHFIDAMQGMAGAYYQALDFGSELILGPLDSADVSALENLPDRLLPMLALNLRAEAAMPADAADTAEAQAAEQSYAASASSFFFALPPEDSARNSAELMLDRGLKNVILLAPDEVLGRRLADAFAGAMQQAGGTVLRQAFYTPGQLEFTQLLNDELGLFNSQRRLQRLQQLLQEKLGFRIRADTNIDGIFLAADQGQSRLLVPQLKFVDADYLPVYATNRVYSAQRNAANDRDLDNVHFTLAAWLLGADPAPALQMVIGWYPEMRNEVLARLFALGRDSLLISAYLQMLQGDDLARLEAASGGLHVDAQGIVQRQLQHAVYRNGAVSLVPQ